MGEAILHRRFDPGREALKLVAVATMTIDHIGAVLYPEVGVLRIIGRISFPLFCYLIVLGVSSTRNVKNYLLRLLVFAFVSQIPYFMAHDYGPFDSLNIYFTLFFGALGILNPFLLVLSLMISLFLNFDYGPYGIALISAMQLLKGNQKWGIVMIIVFNVLFYFMWANQVFSLLALPLVIAHGNGLLGKGRLTSGSPYPVWRKYIFYCYYPAHLTVLVLIRMYSRGF